MAQTKGTTTNLTKLVSWDIDEYQAFTDDECYVCLTEKEMYLIRNSLRVMEWWTRWTSELNTTLPDIATIAENLAFKVSGEQCLDICQAIIECIDTDTDVQNAIRDFAQLNTGYNTPSNNSIANETGLINPTDCDYDEIWGNAVALWTIINQTTIDTLEILKQSTNRLQILADAISAIPVIGSLPIDEAIGFVDQVTTWSLANYEAGLTVTLEQQIQCDLFCLMIEDCTFSFDDLFQYFQGYFTEDLSFYTLLQYMTWMTGVAPTGEPIVYLMTVFQLYIVSIGEKYFGVNTADFYAISAQLGEPDNDWELLCDECAPEITRLGGNGNADMAVIAWGGAPPYTLTTGTYNAGSDTYIGAIAPDNNYGLLKVTFTFPSPTTVQRIQLSSSITVTRSGAGSNFEIFADGSVIYTELLPVNATPHVFAVDFTTPTLVTVLTFAWAVGGSVGSPANAQFAPLILTI